jgi:hypothetical protein
MARVQASNMLGGHLEDLRVDGRLYEDGREAVNWGHGFEIGCSRDRSSAINRPVPRMAKNFLNAKTIKF